jgi:hypothetical protein
MADASAGGGDGVSESAEDGAEEGVVFHAVAAAVAVDNLGEEILRVER